MMSIQHDVMAFNGTLSSPHSHLMPLLAGLTHRDAAAVVLTTSSPAVVGEFFSQTSDIISGVTSSSFSIEDGGSDFSDKNNNSYNTVSKVLIVFTLMIIIIGTIVGNILVWVAICLVRKLRRPYNYLLVSLAVSDLCVAILVMPMALVYEVLGGKWPFGPVACNVWISFDVLSCTASILNLCMISVDRYFAITKPLVYGVKRTPRRMAAYIMFVWIGAAFVSVPPVLLLGNTNENTKCLINQNFYYQIYATFVSFYIPLTVMVTVYYKIFQAAKRIVDEERKAQAHLRLVEERGIPKPIASHHQANKAPPLNNQRIQARRSSLVQINNGEVETKLVPPLDAEAVPCPGQWQGRVGVAQCPNHLGQVAPSPTSFSKQPYHEESQMAATEEIVKRDSTASQLLEIPLIENRHIGSISPMSTVTTCESNWSLGACREIVLAHGAQNPSEGERETERWRASPTNDAFCNKESSLKKLGSENENGSAKPDLEGNEDNIKPINNASHSFKPNNFVKLTLKNESLPNKGIKNGKSFGSKLGSILTSKSNKANKSNKTAKQPEDTDPCSEALLDDAKSPKGELDSRKSSAETNSPKKRFIHTHKTKLKITLAKERKASTTLGIIMSAFIICWLPFFVLALIRPFITQKDNLEVIPNTISSFFMWLGYANSLLNPIIYATLNKDFRKPFQEILCLRCSTLNVLMREEFYYSQYGHDTPNHSHVRCSVPIRERGDSLQNAFSPSHYDDPMTESRF